VVLDLIVVGFIVKLESGRVNHNHLILNYLVGILYWTNCWLESRVVLFGLQVCFCLRVHLNFHCVEFIFILQVCNVL
jgi:hypothetical protein